MEHRTVITGIGALLVLSFLVGSTHGGATSGSEVAITTGDPDQQQMVEWAVARFELAGLELPEVSVRFPGRDLALCGGAQGRTYTDRQPMEIDVCWNDSFVLLHELAHAWMAGNVPEDRRQAFMAMRTSVLAWTGEDIPWEQRGVEHAANVIAWGMVERPFPVSRTYPNDRDSLKAAFSYLTDAEPLHDGGPEPYQPDRSFHEGRTNPRLESGR